MGRRRGVKSLLDKLKMEAIREGADEDASVMSGISNFSDSDLGAPGSPLSPTRKSGSNMEGISSGGPPPSPSTDDKPATIEEGEEGEECDSSAATEKTTDDESSEEKNDGSSEAKKSEEPPATEEETSEKPSEEANEVNSVESEISGNSPVEKGDATEETVKAASRESRRESSREHKSRESHREKKREPRKDSPRVKHKEASRDKNKDTSTREHKKDVLREQKKDVPKDARKDTPKEKPIETKGSVQEQKKDVPKDARKGSVQEQKKDVPKDARKEIPKEKSIETKGSDLENPKDKSKDIPKEQNKDVPKSPKKEAPKEKPSESKTADPENSDVVSLNESLSSLMDAQSALGDSFSARSETESPQEDFDGDASLNYFGGDLQETEDDDEMLTWRLDPDVSLSDWTVVIRNKDDDSDATYHLHKNILAVGPRKSEFFSAAFRKSRQAPTTPPNTTKLTFEGVAALVFPLVLDFIYSPDGVVDLNTTNVMGLRHLAKFFGIKLLYKQATDFIPKDITMANVLIYYKHAVALNDDKTLMMAAKHCSRNVLRIDTSHELLRVMDAQFFKRILTDVGDTKAKRYHSSIILAEFFKIQKEHLDTSSFLMLVDEKLLPMVHHTVALDLLELEADVVIVTASILKFTEVTSLQKRCIKDLSFHWKELSDIDRDQVSRVCRKLSSGVVTDLLIKTLAQVKRKAVKMERGLVTSDSSHSLKSEASAGSKPPLPPLPKTDYEAKIAEQERAHQEEMTMLKKQYEANLMKLRDLCVEKDKHIANYWQELQRYQRLPNMLDGKFINSGMMNKPTKMPEIGNVPVEGHLYQKKGEKKKYPMFYYKAD